MSNSCRFCRAPYLSAAQGKSAVTAIMVDSKLVLCFISDPLAIDQHTKRIVSSTNWASMLLHSKVLKIALAGQVAFRAFEVSVPFSSIDTKDVSYLPKQMAASERAVTNSGSIARQIEPKQLLLHVNVSLFSPACKGIERKNASLSSLASPNNKTVQWSPGTISRDRSLFTKTTSVERDWDGIFLNIYC